MNWHEKTIQQVMEGLASSPRGLSAAEAARRLKKHGPNVLVEKERKTPLAMLADQFRDFMILVLVAAALISGFIGELSDTIAILVIIVLNAVIGFIQEYRADKAMEALKKMAAHSATVLRDNGPVQIPARDLVPGDMVIFEAGNVIPADMRLVEAVRVSVEEAALTGESAPVKKDVGALAGEDLPLGDRRNMAYKGTHVTAGRGCGAVVATGMDTEFGRIAAMLQDAEEGRTPLQKRLAVFSRKLAVAVLAICVIILVIGLLRGEPFMLMLLTAVSLAVAAIPEALPAVITIALALGAKKLVRLNALVRRLPAVETLGSVTYICSDKTGTLTMNRMTVEEIFVDGRWVRAGDTLTPGDGETPDALLMAALALCNDAREDSGGTVLGDPTETALYEVARRYGFRKEDLQDRHGRVAEIPFDSERKCMTTFHEWDGAFVSFTKGAPDVLAEKARRVLTSRGLADLEGPEVRDINDRMAAEGLRVLAVAMKTWTAVPEDLSPGRVEEDLTLLGLAGMMDPPRKEAGEAVALCRRAGIRTVMITGDHPVTARAIARRIGMLKDGDGAVVTGRELAGMSQEEFKGRVEKIGIYARVAPEQKLRIVEALQDRGQYVAMTGDGVNDAPALKRADIGVAMGITGTDVSKEAAPMILLDDDFATIVKAVQEGRRIFDNIRKFIKYTMTSNSGEIWTLFLAPFFGLPLPLLPIHILWINLVTDGLPGLALAVEPAEKGVMERPPRDPRESIFAGGLGRHIIWVGLLMGAVCLVTQAWFLGAGQAHWQTMVFTVLCLSQMGNVLAVRSESESLFRQGLLSNRPLLGAFLLTFLLQMATIYVPFLNPVFKTAPLSLKELLITLLLSSVVFFAVEGEKFFKRRRSYRSHLGSRI